MSDLTATPIEIPEISTEDILTCQAMFGQAVSTNPDILRIINAYGPILFASVLFSLCEDYAEDESAPAGIVARRSVTEAEEQAIGILRGVASAMGKYTDEVSTDPSDSEIDADTEINPV